MLLSTSVYACQKESIVDQNTPLVRPEPLTSRSDPTLADIMAFVARDREVTASHRRNWLSAIRCLARILGQDPRLIPAAPGALAIRYKDVVPAANGITNNRWSNIRSRTLAAIAQAGIPIMRGRSATALTPEWRQLVLALPTPRARHGLSRFMRFCCDQNIRPGQVDGAAFEHFRQALLTTSANRSPHHVHRTAAEQWNKAAVGIQGWPTVTVPVPRHDRFYSYEWSDFPPSLQTDVAAFLARSGSSNPFADDYVRPLRAGTIDLRRRQIRQMASLLVAGGTPIEQVSGLAVLVEVRYARTILEQLYKRACKNSVQLHGMAQLLKTIAQHWVRAPAEAVRKIAGFARNVAPKRRGMTRKNRDRLHQFNNPQNIRLLLDLPRKVFRELKRTSPSDREAAVRAMYALAVELLLAAPMRLDNLVGLDRHRHIIAHRGRPKASLHLFIPGEETKTGEDYELSIPADTADLINTYIKVARPRIITEPTQLIFPNAAGRRRSNAGFARGLNTFVERETGLVMNPHLFRHLAVTLYLHSHPEDVETARRLLGHRSIQTTLNFYAAIKTELSFERYDAFIQGLRSKSPARERASFPVQRNR
jgi:integrase